MSARRRKWGSAVLLLALAACFDASEEGATSELETIDADKILYGVSLNMSREGIREALLTADSMFIWRDSTHSRVLGLTLLVFDQGGRRRARITASEGRLNQLGNELTASGNAVLTIPEQDREIRTDELHFAPEADRVWTDVDVVMREGECEIEGDRLQADMAFDDVRIWGTRERECASR
ncbi:MAG: LPS export ABC transporter periplasmic protein LptC [Gemmatimonadetes bacterium]|nr:LPS export ABC transporter periplasmic protein LptC [Gemmatimonadota bacterium]